MNPLLLSRTYSIGASVKRSARLIRKEFLDYFCKEHGHTSIPSSPVAPLTDPTLTFVNSGMNQFKGVFLNYHGTSITKAANSQKCLRIGGKHNDLKLVGQDGYHHTFFEMLGNWSFGSYFKEEACRYAWNLLTQQYGINKEFLYVTYFGGDPTLGLNPDTECRDIWLRIGVPQNKVLPFGMKENFWEMGPMGPCGPCTEIHVDLTKASGNRSSCVNRGYSDLTELWNIVFIQHERLENQSIINLEKQFVDTGMGFERVVALLQDKTSNYDTDLFTPLFNVIEKFYGAPSYKGKFGQLDTAGLDNAYRILADHMRAVTVALADGIIPEKNHKLRRLIRKVINTGRNTFKKDGVLSELAYCVAENLGDTYPELHSNMNKVQALIQFEENVYTDLRERLGDYFTHLSTVDPLLCKLSDWVIPGLINGYKKIKIMLDELEPGSVIPGNLSYVLYDTYGIPPEAQADLAEIYSLKYDDNLLRKELESKKIISKLGIGHLARTPVSKLVQTLQKHRVSKTNDFPKYMYTFDGNEYQFPDTNCKLLGLYVDGRLILNARTKISAASNHSTDIVDMSVMTANDTKYIEDHDIAILLDRTPCYATEGGQGSDKGSISINNVEFDLYNVKKVNDYVLHFGKYSKSNSLAGPEQLIKENKLDIENDCIVRIANEHRQGLMKHHTVIHLLHEAVEKVLDVFYQRSYFAGAHSLEYSVASREVKLTQEHLLAIEDVVNAAIKANIRVNTKVIDSLDLYKEKDLRLHSGATYPYTGIRIVEIESNQIKSREPCCGTHVLNTGHLEKFYILKFEAKPTGVRLEAVTGPLAAKATAAGEEALRQTKDFIADVVARRVLFEEFKFLMSDFIEKLKEQRFKKRIPLWHLTQCYKLLEEISETVRIQSKETEMSAVSAEIMAGARKSNPFITCHLPRRLTYLSLHEVLERHQTIPMFLIMSEDNVVKARCSVPQALVSDDFNATKWMKAVLKVFSAKLDSMKNIDPHLMAKMNSKRVQAENIDSLIQQALAKAIDFATMHIHQEQMQNPTQTKAEVN